MPGIRLEKPRLETDRPTLDSLADDPLAHELLLEIFEKHPRLHEMIEEGLEDASTLISHLVKFALVTHTLIRSEESTDLEVLRKRKWTISRPTPDELDILE